MNALASVTYYILPLLSLVILALGLIKRHARYVLIALWLSLVSLYLQYQSAGGEILGTYFDYQKALLYTITLLTMLSALLYWILHTPIFHKKYLRSSIGLVFALLATGSTLLLINLWINARFIANRLQGTALMQVASFNPPAYCSYRYVFYKIDKNGKVSYLCPNHYGFIPSVGHLDVTPDFLSRQLVQPLE
ncbi:type I secretion system protein LssZ [Legionella nagasakiensis]|uniref:type I secretion system protein LssZ n=1 Tax=Legionella nagasakiensis TaxID=535290 RepID=UPI0010561BC6|nr:type I secretion system protein LssZ [Legionella nagasakiensis]